MGIFSHISLIIQLSALKINKCVKKADLWSAMSFTVMKKETVPEALLQIRFPISTFLNSFRHLINLFQRRMSRTASAENIFRSWFPLLLKSTGLKFLPSLRSIRSLTFKFLVTESTKIVTFLLFSKNTRKSNFIESDQNSVSPAILKLSI